MNRKILHTPDGVRYEITTPVETEITIAGETHCVEPGSYLFFSEKEDF